MYSKSINQKTKLVFEKIAKSELVARFYLVGGTALAIQLGHRESIDLDFFSKENFSNAELKNKLPEIGKFYLSSEEEGTLHGVLDEVKLSFLKYDYNLLYPLIDFDGIKMADERDIAAMKIDAISSRGSKKDFIDLYFLLEKYSLEELISFFEKKFNQMEYNKLHILKSLVFFADAENEPMPVMRKGIGWEEIKKKIIAESRKIAP